MVESGNAVLGEVLRAIQLVMVLANNSTIKWSQLIRLQIQATSRASLELPMIHSFTNEGTLLKFKVDLTRLFCKCPFPGLYNDRCRPLCYRWFCKADDANKAGTRKEICKPCGLYISKWKRHVYACQDLCECGCPSTSNESVYQTSK